MRKKSIVLLMVSTLVLFFSAFLGEAAYAQSKIVKKTVKKIIKPEIAPVPAPETPSEEAIPTPPPPPPTPEATPYSKGTKGIFGWGINIDLGAAYQANRSASLLGIKGDLVFDDPFKFGSNLDLAEDAIQYKLGLGFLSGNDNNNTSMSSIPLLADAVVYLPEGLLLGLDPYVGAGINCNLYGTGKISGGIGYQISAGVLVGPGTEAGKTGIEIGYAAYNVGSALSSQGISIGVSHPCIL